MFVATRAMEQNQRRFGWIGASDEVMHMGRLVHGEVRQRRIDL
jgi:hypothetical protein